MLQKEIVRNMPKELDDSNMRRVQKPPAEKKEGKYPAHGPMVDTIDRKSPSKTGKKNRRKERRLIERVSQQVIVECENFEQHMRDILSTLPKKNYSRNVARLLFKIWANDYDRHMAATKHEMALDLLLSQAVALDSMTLGYNGRHSIIGERVLEMAGGTGTVIKLLCKKMPEDAAKLQVTLNDISPAMIRIAKKKLAEEACKASYTGYDIRELPFRSNTRDTVIMSQVLHLVNNPKALEEERYPDAMPNYMEHTRTKIDVIRKAFDILKKNGYFMLIDEWPAILSNSTENTFERAVSYLFRSTFRPVENPMALRANIMRNIPSARFVAELKIPIDGRHSMYLHLYRKDIDKLENNERPAKRGEIPDEAKVIAQKRVMEALKAVDGHFIHRYRLNNLSPSNGSGPMVDFLPMKGPAGDEQVFDSRNEKLSEDVPKDSYNGAIVGGQLFNAFLKQSDGERIDTMSKVVESVRTGGWLAVLGEWPTSGPNDMSKHYFRDTLMKNFNVMFQAALRARVRSGFVNSVYGYLFRKKG